MIEEIKKISTYEELVKYVNDELSSDGPFVNPSEFTMTEINVWTYWQGMGNRNPRIMLLGQDWGSIKNKTNQKYLTGISEIKDIDQSKVHYFDIMKGKMNFATDRNLCDLFKELGKDNIKETRYDDLFFTNLIPGLRAEIGSAGGLSKAVITESVQAEFEKLVEILRPQVIICLGRMVYESVLNIYSIDKPKINTWTGFIKDFYEKPVIPVAINESTYIFPVVHPGAYGTKNRSITEQENDWAEINKWMKQHIPTIP